MVISARFLLHLAVDGCAEPLAGKIAQLLPKAKSETPLTNYSAPNRLNAGMFWMQKKQGPGQGAMGLGEL